MRNFYAILSCLISIILVSCRTDVVRSVPEVLYTVPTDAVMVYSADRLDDVLGMAFDSTDAVRGLMWGRLSGRSAAVSFVFNRNLSPVVCVDAGRASSDTIALVPGLICEAERAGFQARYFPGESIGRACNLLLLTRSEAVYSAVCRHLEARRSVMDLETFVQAYGIADGEPCQIVRNSAFEQILPAKYMKGGFKRSELLKFASHCSDWMVVVNKDGRKTVRTVQHSDGAQFANVLPALEAAESRLPELLHEENNLVLDLPVGGGFRGKYEDWRYACSNLDKYEKSLAAVKKERKMDPLKWEKEAGVREVALICWGKEAKVIAIRADRLPDVPDCSANDLKGVAAALYGSAFAGPADSCCVRRGSWLICGSKPDVEAFPDARVITEMPAWWPQKACKFVIRYNGRTMYSDAKGINIIE